MKKTIAILLILPLVLCACGSKEFERADEISADFIAALLLRDESVMKELLHPDHAATALPDDEFYERLEDQYLPVGNELSALEAGTKNYVENTSLEGTVLQCNYIVRANELFYDAEIIILDNDNGYGIVAVSMELNLEYLSVVNSEE